MKIKNIKRSGTIAGIIAALLIVITLFALSWIITCGIIKLITLCFGWTFSWPIATGIWLVMILLRKVFVQSSSSKK